MGVCLRHAPSHRRQLRSAEGTYAEMDEEMRFHLEMQAERLQRERGLAPEEARRQAAIAFGGMEKYKEEGQEARGLAWLSGLSLDLKLAWRMLKRSPGLTSAANVHDSRLFEPFLDSIPPLRRRRAGRPRTRPEKVHADKGYYIRLVPRVLAAAGNQEPDRPTGRGFKRAPGQTPPGGGAYAGLDQPLPPSDSSLRMTR